MNFQDVNETMREKNWNIFTVLFFFSLFLYSKEQTQYKFLEKCIIIPNFSVCKMKDSCYYKVKSRVAVFPSARASQMIAKCRKKSGHVRKSQAGSNLKRWSKEKWINTKTGKPCGNEGKDHTQYCRPSKKISSKTPTLAGGKKDKTMQSRKRRGLRALPRRHR